jgi:NADPH-dependent glutamate synthase beta subunit-like oxidoreductase
MGLGQLGALLDEVLDLQPDSRRADLLPLIEKTATAIKDSSDCAIGSEAANMVLKGLKGFRADYEHHIKAGSCAPEVKKLKESVPCVGLCPARVDIPGYVALVQAGRYADAIRVIRKDNPFPAVCALICEHPCEKQCRRTLIDSPIHIRAIKGFAVDNAGKVPAPAKMDNTGKKVAVIGGGPSGLTAAYYLAIMGHKVTVFEKRHNLGGMLLYGIPSYRLPRQKLQYDIDTILSLGVEVKLGFDVDDVDDIQEIRENFDAVYISIGAHTFKTMGIPGEDAIGVIPAVDMLRGIGDGHLPEFEGKSVVVIGGGNVAMDVARTAKRLGASRVSIVYRRRKEDMTALLEEIDGAIEEGCELMQLLAPVEVVVENDQVKGIMVQQQIVGEADPSGRPKPRNAKGVEPTLVHCDLIISAIGQAIDMKHFETYGIPAKWGNIDAGSDTVVAKVPGVFSGGDCVTGPSTVIKAIAAGKVAAANIDNFLGYHHEIELDVDIPNPLPHDKRPCGRTELKLRDSHVRVRDFDGIELEMSAEEADQETSRCLRCDQSGFGSLRGGRELKW